MFLEIIYLICMYKKDLALNNLQWLICHKTKTKPTKRYMWAQFPNILAWNNPRRINIVLKSILSTSLGLIKWNFVIF